MYLPKYLYQLMCQNLGLAREWTTSGHAAIFLNKSVILMCYCHNLMSWFITRRPRTVCFLFTFGLQCWEFTPCSFKCSRQSHYENIHSVRLFTVSSQVYEWSQSVHRNRLHLVPTPGVFSVSWSDCEREREGERRGLKEGREDKSGVGRRRAEGRIKRCNSSKSMKTFSLLSHGKVQLRKHCWK